jgi:hypothetical protein
LDDEHQMAESKLELDSITMNYHRADWDAGAIAEQIFNKLNGSFSREAILGTIKDTIPKYEDARIQTYVPILLQRDVINKLLSMEETSASPVMGIEGVRHSEGS